MAPRASERRSAAAVLLAAVVLVFVGRVFGLNGRQWGWWEWASFAGAVVLVAVAVLRRRLRAAAARLPRSVVPAAGLSGAAALVAALALMSSRYSDPYDGPLFWPHALALVGLAGFAVAAVSASALAPRGRGRLSRG